MSGDFTFLKGNIETIILCALYNEDKYGYEIAKEIKERTSNKYEIKQPTLYSYLKRLEEDDLIVSYWGESSNGGRRRYYALTKVGRENCERFISEWQYQRTVLSDLVDGTADGTEITQEEATPLFGRRTRRPKRNQYQAELEQQDEIARRLSELTGASTEQTTTTVSEEEEQVVEQQEPVAVEQEPVVTEQPATETETTAVVEEINDVVNEPVTVEIAEPETVYVQEQEDTHARFTPVQDNPEDFIQDFNERARVVTDRQQPSDGENYQHVLMGVLGDQLDGMDQMTSDNTATMYYEDRHAALEDVADSLAREGIRLRIYNHATASYKSKRLIPFAKVLCQTSWLSYAIACIILGALALATYLTSRPDVTFSVLKPYVIAVGVLLAVPLGFTIYLIIDPTRREKPLFNFRIAVIVASAVCAIIILASVGICALIGSLEISDFVAVSKQILIPTCIAVLIPASVSIYYTLYKKY